VTGQTLVAGPHAAELIESLPAGELTVLVRGLADAETLDGRWAHRGDITVWGGSLEKVAAVPTFDTIVALDGLDRLCSAEAETLDGWDDRLAHLLALLRPGGRLLLAAENLFGVHRLLALPRTPGDAEWLVADDRDPRRPAGPADLRSRLVAAGLSVPREYAAYPSVLLSREILADAELTGYLSAVLASAVETTADVLADPVRLVTGALRHGLAAELAPSWVVIAQRAADGPGIGRLDDDGLGSTSSLDPGRQEPDGVVDGRPVAAAPSRTCCSPRRSSGTCRPCAGCSRRGRGARSPVCPPPGSSSRRAAP
jgi:hypothetical protein